ncbi:gas vesicle protein GvpO [Nonomuraea fuscirosea]|uniref:Gas vesicle protein GvpO n=1 Tax=Nonomuraea fuscirosea TaxID=1291556 RepID=A0A2T0N6Q2_9ACTN|nr:gas vesicle protein [Nonomuraea fuscirosea]PRX68262.1 gas vesicle protein GvpO [Nonomuraea fuscirosea]
MTIRRPAAEQPRVRRRFRTDAPSRSQDQPSEQPPGRPSGRPPEQPSERSPEPERGRPGGGLTAVTAGGVGQRQIAELTTKHVEGVTSVAPADGGWVIDVEVVEDRRIPSSGDILALYQVQIDKEGSLLSYRRIRRYKRSNAEYSEAY